MTEWLVYVSKGKACGFMTLAWSLLLLFAAVLAFKFSGGLVPKKEWDRIFLGWKLQRHEFNNHLQVISAMIQLGKADMVLNYIEDVKKRNELFSVVCSLEDPHIMGEVLNLIILLKEKGYDIFIKVPSDFDPKKVRLKDVEVLKKKVLDILKDGKGLKDAGNLQIVFPETLYVYDSKPDII
ncbi:MAG: Spo0B domain-containing protein [Bacillota bacterium]